MTQEITLSNERSRLISQAIEVWLASKEHESGNNRTKKIYRDTIGAFRAQLLTTYFDLDGLPVSREPTIEDREQALTVLSLAADGWGSSSRSKTMVAAATYNQRLSILSSFYRFIKRRRLLIMDNPIDMLDRKDIQEYAGAQPLSREQVEQALRSIDRTSNAGRRDYALLLVFFSTGRRASEVLSLQWKHVQMIPEERTAILHFEHCKGGKEMFDKLELRVWNALRDYLQSVVSRNLSIIEPEQSLWLSFSKRNYKRVLTQRGLGDIFMKHFKTMKVHTTRHTFAHGMQKAGAKTRDIKKRLGHSSEETTERYLEQLTSAENEYARALMDYFGVED